MFAIDDARLLLGKYEIAFGLGYDSSCGRASAIERSKPKRKDHYVGSPNICRIQQQRLTAAGMTSQDRSDQADERTEIHQGADCRQNKSQLPHHSAVAADTGPLGIGRCATSTCLRPGDCE
jgi:hypothetical protein